MVGYTSIGLNTSFGYLPDIALNKLPNFFCASVSSMKMVTVHLSLRTAERLD